MIFYGPLRKCLNDSCNIMLDIWVRNTRRYCSRACSNTVNLKNNTRALNYKFTEDQRENRSKTLLGNLYCLGNQNSLGHKYVPSKKTRVEASIKRVKYIEENGINFKTVKSVFHGLKCQSSYEKYFIEILYFNGVQLPINCKSTITPFGARLYDFEHDEMFYEIKSKWTYQDYPNSLQEKKDKWVSENIKPVKVIII